ncbi:MAG TPA: adenylate/guanylate cyclase domain-containing protein [Herpetosiphonaceae bacterium]
MLDLPPADLEFLKSVLPMPLWQSFQESPSSPEIIAALCSELEAQVSQILPFVPSPIVTAYLAQGDPPKSSSRYSTGTLILAEITGFTQLATELAATGWLGSEETSTILQDVFAVVVDEIYRRGGGVIKFTGDTFTAFFDATRLGNQHTALACAAALAMQRQMAQYANLATSIGAVELGLRITAHSGKLFAAEVGDETHAELIITGRVVNRAAVTHEHAAPGEITLREETLRLLKHARAERKQADLFRLLALEDEQQYTEFSQLAPALEPPSLDSARVLLRRLRAFKPYMARNLPPRFLKDLHNGEFRPIVALFTNFYSFNRLLDLLELPALVEGDPALVGHVLNTYYARTQAIVHDLGGSINKVDMATFGNRLMAVFGASVSREDDPARAVQAALALRDSQHEINRDIAALLRSWSERYPEQRLPPTATRSLVRQRISVARGVAFVGVVGTAQRREYMLLGEPVNLASRLLSIARDDDLLVPSLTYRAVRQIVEGQALPTISFDGFSRPVGIFQISHKRDPLYQSAPAVHAAPLVGRADELAQMLQAAAAALNVEASEGRLIVLTSEPGLGKSRLIEELLTNLQSAHTSTLIVRDSCASYEQNAPYATIARLLRQILRLSIWDDRNTQAIAAQQQLGEFLPQSQQFGPLLAPILGLPIPETVLTQALTPEQRHERLHDLLSALILAVAHARTLVLAIDDFHWIDASSRAIVQRLVEEMVDYPILLCLSSRSFSEADEGWLSVDYGLRIALPELSMAQSAALLQSLLDGHVPSQLQPLLDRTHGSPVLLEEIIRYLHQSGALQRDERGAWVCTRAIDHSTTPVEVQQLMMARLDQLPDAARSTLLPATVLGQRFELRVLSEIVADPAGLPEHVNVLVRAGMLTPCHDMAELAYAFRHALVRDVVYNSMSYAQRRRIHAGVATAIETLYADELDAQRVILANHYAAAERWAQALPHFVQAAQSAQARYANSEALTLYEQAAAIALMLDAQPGRALTAATYEGMGDVLALTGNPSGARNTYGRLLDLLRTESSPEQLILRARIQRKIGSTFEHQANTREAFTWLTHAVDAIVAAGAGHAAELEHTRILSDIGFMYFREAHLDQAQHYLDQALTRVKPLQVYDEQARILNRLGGVAWQRADVAMAQTYVEQALAASEQSGNLVDQINMLNNLGLIMETQGLLADALRSYRRAIQLNEGIGNPRMAAILSNNAGGVLYNRGDYQQAHDYFAQSLEFATAVRDPYNQVRALLNLGRVLTRLERWESAERHLLQSQFLIAQLNLPPEQLDCLIALAELAIEQGNIADAQEWWEQARPLASDTESEEFGRFQRLEAQMALASGDRERAIELLTENIDFFIQLQHVPEADWTLQLLLPLLTPAQQLE